MALSSVVDIHTTVSSKGILVAFVVDGFVFRLFVFQLDWGLGLALAFGSSAVDLGLLLGGFIVADIGVVVVRFGVVASFVPLRMLVLHVEPKYRSRWTYSSLIIPPRLRLPAPTLVSLVFFGGAFLRGVAALADGTEK